MTLLSARAATTFPSARVVVLDGSALLAGRPTEVEPGVQVQTLLGHLAYRLGGAAAFADVAAQDANLEGSSTTQLAKLLAASAPCLILLDEVLEYLVKALPVKTGDGDLAGDDADADQGALDGGLGRRPGGDDRDSHLLASRELLDGG